MYQVIQLENFLPEIEAELLALEPECPGHTGMSTEEDGHLALLLLLQLGEDFVPVGPTRVHPGLEPRDEVPLLLLVKEVQRHLQGHGLHVVPLEGGGDVHVHIQEPDKHNSVLPSPH